MIPGSIAERQLRVHQATAADLPGIREAYAAGRALQLASGFPAWPIFPDAAILEEVDEGRLFLVRDEEALAGVFSLAYADPAIWGAHERGAHLYLHRIARSPAWRGGRLVEAVLAWAEAHARALGREGLRMDTWADHAPLIAYYERLGFTLLGRRRVPPDPRLPPHYHGVELALLERALGGTDTIVGHGT